MFIYVGVTLLRGNNISTEGISLGTAAVVATTSDVLNKTKKAIKDAVPKKNNKNANVMNVNNNNSKNVSSTNNNLPLNKQNKTKTKFQRLRLQIII